MMMMNVCFYVQGILSSTSLNGKNTRKQALNRGTKQDTNWGMHVDVYPFQIDLEKLFISYGTIYPNDTQHVQGHLFQKEMGQ